MIIYDKFCFECGTPVFVFDAKSASFSKKKSRIWDTSLINTVFAQTQRKLQPFRAATTPIDKQSLESWLCTAQYYSDFIPRFATLFGPLNVMRRKDVKFEWTSERQAAFDAIKSALAYDSMRVLQ